MALEHKSIGCIFCNMRFVMINDTMIEKYFVHFNEHIQKQLSELKKESCSHDFCICSKCGIKADG